MQHGLTEKKFHTAAIYVSGSQIFVFPYGMIPLVMFSFRG